MLTGKGKIVTVSELENRSLILDATITYRRSSFCPLVVEVKIQRVSHMFVLGKHCRSLIVDTGIVKLYLTLLAVNENRG